MSVKARFVAVGHMTVIHAIGKDGTSRYYKPTEKTAANNYDARGLGPTSTQGFPVFDKELSTSFAVSLHATFAEADTFAAERNAYVTPVEPDPVKADMLKPEKPYQTYDSKRKPK